MSDNQTKGRRANAAEPLGERSGLVSRTATTKTGKREITTAGPDGPDATVIGDTFKHPPGSAAESA
ncbi:MAG: hypothetical protein JWM33_355 [Caulobacteraceae bacterium]|nr:hypothetical protein [Caulobacteraceae bacterium]